MSLFQITLFGCPTVFSVEDQLEVKLTRTIQCLLAYLLLDHNRNHSREILASVFWRDQSQERARASLNTALWRLRSALEGSHAEKVTFFLVTQQGEIRLNRECPYWLDVEAFEQIYSSLAAGQAEPEQAEAAEALYQGELMEGFYDDWVLRERERLRAHYMMILSFLMMTHKQQGQYERSLTYGQKILDMEPLREEVHRQMMRTYLQAGQRVQALQQYEACRSVLQSELNILPMPETQQLYEDIMNQALVPVTGSRDAAPPTPIDQINAVRRKAEARIAARKSAGAPVPSEPLRTVLDELDQAVRLSTQAQEKIDHAIHSLERMIGKE